MTLHLTIKPITEWLALAAVGAFVLGLVLTFLTGAVLEIGSLMFASFGTIAAVILLLLAVGTLL